MLFEPQEKLSLISCETCKSTGFVGFSHCKVCHGMSVGRMVNGTFLYWGTPLNRYHIATRKGRRQLEKFRVIGAVIFGIGFLALFMYSVYTQELILDLVKGSFWESSPNYVALFLWFSIISFSYLVYRGIIHRRPLKEINYKQEQKEPRIEEEQGPGSFEEIRKNIPSKKRLDISEVFTVEAKKVLEEAYNVADRYQSEDVSPAHVFYALLMVPNIASVFLRLGISMSVLQASIAKLFTKRNIPRNPLLSHEVKDIMFRSYEQAYDRKESQVRSTNLLVAAVFESEPLQELLYDLKVDKEKLENVVAWVRIREKLREQYLAIHKAGAHRSKHGIDRAMTAVATPYLNKFSQDITLAAKYGHLGACVARDKEIEEIFRIIEGGRQSIALVGEHGVGKMSIVEGIAQLMVEERVPKRLHDKRLVQLSTSALLSGTTMNGAIERLRRMMHEISKAGNIILFINNIHDLVTVGGETEGLDVSEVLAEFLGPGRFLTITSTTTEGYNKHITNTQLGTVLSRVNIKEMNHNQAIQVLESKVGGVEYKQKVFFSYDAIAASVKFAEKFLHDQQLPESAIDIMAEGASYTKNKKGESHLVTAEDIASIISNKTGIPTTSISEDESDKLLRLEEEMHKRIIGQDEAVILVSNALRRARAEIRSTKRPIANFLFLGPTGVGKTELAKTISSVYFGGEERMIRIDMSEFQDKGSIYRLIGQPGQQGTGLLTESVRQQPFSLILLDEMEKANKDVLNIFLQVFDDGRLTDSVGRVIDFTNAIIIATSNAGTGFVQEKIQEGVKMEDIRQELVRGKLKEYYRPEFLNRFDGIVLFKALEKEEIKKIARLMLKRVEKDLEARGVALRVEDAALEALADAGFDPEFGARPMRRAIQEHVENALADLILQGKLKRRNTVVIGEGINISIE